MYFQQKSAAHKRLAVELGHDKYDEANIRAAVHTDFVYDNLMFAVEKGFPWDHVCSVAKFSSTLLQDAIGMHEDIWKLDGWNLSHQLMHASIDV